MTIPNVSDSELKRLLALVPRPAAPAADLADRIAARARVLPQSHASIPVVRQRFGLRRHPFVFGAMIAANALAAAAAASSWDGQRFDIARLADLPRRVATTLHLPHLHERARKSAQVPRERHARPSAIGHSPAQAVMKPVTGYRMTLGAPPFLHVRAAAEIRTLTGEGRDLRQHHAERRALHARTIAPPALRLKPERHFHAGVVHPSQPGVRMRAQQGIEPRVRTPDIPPRELRPERPFASEENGSPLIRNRDAIRPTDRPDVPPIEDRSIARQWESQHEMRAPQRQERWRTRHFGRARPMVRGLRMRRR